MKRSFLCIRTALIGISLFAVSSCYYDDSELRGRLDQVESKVAELEKWCTTVNQEILSLKGLVEALENNDFVTEVMPSEEGYVITFSKGGNITIKNGKDGQDGEDGKDGGDGKDGKDGVNGVSPVIGVAKAADGLYYWTVQTGTGAPAWMTDANGDKIRTTGDEGDKAISPTLKTGSELGDGYKADAVYLSVDGGGTWTKVSGDNGTNGTDGVDGTNGTDGKDAVFAGMDNSDPDYVVFILSDNTPDDLTDNPTLRIPKYIALGLDFFSGTTPIDLSRTIAMDEMDGITYQIKGDAGKVRVSLFRQTNDGWLVTVDETNRKIDATAITGKNDVTLMATDNAGHSTFYLLSLTKNAENDGTAAKPYRIRNKADLMGLAYSVNRGDAYSGRHFRLEADIDLNGTRWTPVGGELGSAGFSGVLDGQGHTVSNLKIEKADVFYYYGLVGYAVSAEIKNIRIESPKFEVLQGERIGGLIGGAQGSTVTGCQVTDIEVNGENCGNIGGLIGVAENSDIESCTVLGGEIIGQSYVGGLIGDVNAGTVLHSRAACAVAAENVVGGLIGLAQQVGTITDCSATGNVILTGVRGSYAGGLIGGNSSSFSAQTIMACYATGTVTSGGNGPVNLGGLIGRNDMNGATQSIVLCYATGDVSSATHNRENYLGGLIGASRQQSTQSILACYATGTVSTTGSYDKNVGGLFGRYDLYDGVARMTGCYTTCNKGTYGFGTGSDETRLTLTDVEIIAGPVTDKVSDMNRAAEGFPYQYDENAKIISME